jgi:rhodanese-related sulfurtransferase
MPRKKSSRRRRKYSSRSSLGTALRRPIVQIGILVVVAIVIFLIASMGGKTPASVSVDKAHQMYEAGTFVLDVRTLEEWNEFHVPNTTLIPLEELAARVNELPKDQPILVVCRSGNRSQTGRDILLQAGFNAISMDGGLNAWRESGYPVVSGP